ncbi:MULTISPECIES: hypothetical protein [unclassified Streptomyces]|uniref:hypothetical protein n=1 Tax=unclassified Streptomyces TaxID=2593676 RepID=UPI0004BDF038|nr:MULTISPECIES: hypothetical protein [unclassified Streptomyces]
MIVHFVGGPLAGRGLATTDDPWFGGWFTIKGAAGKALYVPVHRAPVTGAVMAEVNENRPVGR